MQYPLHFSFLLGWVLECFNLESHSGLSINSHREHFVFYRVPSGEKIIMIRILSSQWKKNNEDICDKLAFEDLWNRIDYAK